MSHILCVVDGMTDAAFTAADYPHLSAMECAGRVDTTQGGRTESLNCILHLLGQTWVPPHLRGMRSSQPAIMGSWRKQCSAAFWNSGLRGWKWC